MTTPQGDERAMRGDTITHTSKLVVEDCCNCGMTFAMTADFKRRRREDHGWFYCPAGHGQHYTGKSDLEKERERVARAERLAASRLAQRDQATARADHEAARANGYKGALVATKNRIAKGVCPCCKRSFVDVAKHMTGQHPNYGAGDKR